MGCTNLEGGREKRARGERDVKIQRAKGRTRRKEKKVFGDAVRVVTTYMYFLSAMRIR